MVVYVYDKTFKIEFNAAIYHVSSRGKRIFSCCAKLVNYDQKRISQLHK